MMGLWAVLSDATTTTITSTTRAITTTVQTTTTLGGSTGASNQRVWDRLFDSTELWAALLGALVGGFATAIGSYILSRLQAKKDIRIQMYDDIVPNVANAYEQPRVVIFGVRRGISQSSGVYLEGNLARHLGELRRAGTIVGGYEAQVTLKMSNLVREHSRYEGGNVKEVYLSGTDSRSLVEMDEEFMRLIGELNLHLERKLRSRLSRSRE
jgi:hypothetical protein